MKKELLSLPAFVTVLTVTKAGGCDSILQSELLLIKTFSYYKKKADAVKFI